jgi:hypothetical protein
MTKKERLLLVALGRKRIVERILNMHAALNYPPIATREMVDYVLFQVNS